MDLTLKYKRRNFPVIKGDRIEVMRGRYKGYKNEVVEVNVKQDSLVVEGATYAKTDGTRVPRSIPCSNVKILKLDLSDPWRRRKIVERLSPERRVEIEREVKKEEEAKEREREKEEEEEPEEEEEEKGKEEEEEEKEEEPEEEEEEKEEEPEEKEESKTRRKNE
jgi:large subunit ribosomal protein L24